jgi:hypothetical protein
MKCVTIRRLIELEVLRGLETEIETGLLFFTLVLASFDPRTNPLPFVRFLFINFSSFFLLLFFNIEIQSKERKRIKKRLLTWKKGFDRIREYYILIISTYSILSFLLLLCTLGTSQN